MYKVLVIGSFLCCASPKVATGCETANKSENHYKWNIYMCNNSSTYANTIPTVLCTRNGLICDYITGIHIKKLSHHA